MSRVGRAPIKLPKGVDVKIAGSDVTVKGPMGELARTFPADIEIKLEDGTLSCTRPSDQKEHRALHGLTRALLNNMVVGVTEGFKKELQISGVGFKAEAKKRGVLLNVGYSHPVMVVTPAGVKAEVTGPTTILVSGTDKEIVGQVAATIRSVRKPEPYKGKGIMYTGERIHRKAGKTGK
ncbi:MAG: 50S ribosomal protein L6 [Calditrichaeota bacterium]|nr:50S ribosomal protein L6 [Calditrichota bacterium]MCB9366227.1 50S ribosomal protein L6 [Calditrichota bacterium]MCB9391704.1 50S ribosomal protein L6 [Calditrichota bacterium]